MKKNCFVKEKGQKERLVPSGCVQGRHQIASGIKEGVVSWDPVFMPNDLVERSSH